MTSPAEPTPEAAAQWSGVGSGPDAERAAGAALLMTYESDDVQPAIAAPRRGGASAHQRGLSSPAAFVAVVAVSVLVLIGCVLGAMFTGLFGDFAAQPTEVRTTAAIGPELRRDPVVSFGDGKWLVTRDVEPGTYESAVPVESAGCSWERNASTDGTASSVLDSGSEPAGTRVAVTIKTTDAIFQSLGCGTWRRIGD